MSQAQVQEIAVARIRRNPKIDPRKGRKKASYSAFVESVRANGVLQPILVRPVTDDPNFDFEVVFGNTRHAASVDAGKTTIAAEIRSMSDEEARMLAAVENLQRSDLTPIEEAQHAVVLLADNANDHAAVMKALGWSRTMLDSRILLSHACDAVAEALLEDQIKIGHAELLCRLPAADQPAILSRIIEKGYSVVDTRDRLLTLTRDLGSARFDTEECRTCVHNSGANADLFEVSLGESRCQNAVCWNRKTAALIEVKLIDAQQEFGVAHTDKTLPQDGYIRLEAKGSTGVGETQLAACVTCANYGAVVSTTAGREGEVVGGYCFDRKCNSDKHAQYKALIAEASGATAPPQQGEGSTPEGSAGSRQPASEPGKTRKPATTSKPAQPAQLKRAIRREAFTLYSRMATKAVMDDRRLALAVAVTSMYFDVRNEIPSQLRERMEGNLGIQGRGLTSNQRADLEVKLAQRTEDDLMRLLSSMAACSVFRTDATDQFDKSVSGSQSLAFIQHAGIQPVEHFQMNEAYLKAQVKASIVEDCKRSGFAEKYNEVNGEKAFEKLATGKSEDLIKAVLAFTQFNWLGYLPAALELSAQGGKSAPRSQQTAA
ncbi:PRTRC system ParB family protein [Pseudomonas nitroreducens]|uniref:PRTRC system ParB family protein n=1 Tax=Pseudomonas nitroreducens TaxID=46680 RepID=A0ABS0KPE4_PSENT|nr:PRTRC system ParB family protein [Pseudomonas nitroreducens]MBG6289824.1 PRTRC system ParB family protein [Pseudomonas nitroreducens]MDG9857372.1 PRTRC system ParB family protein [Pseudomonas nitroreducens]MDH1076535.1 PRTRC system ParB family protein [Pseudomonas nitroreducens]